MNRLLRAILRTLRKIKCSCRSCCAIESDCNKGNDDDNETNRNIRYSDL